MDPKAARHDLREPSGEAIDAQLLRIRDMHVVPLVVLIDGRQDRSELSYWPQGGAVGLAARRSGGVCVWPGGYSSGDAWPITIPVYFVSPTPGRHHRLAMRGAGNNCRP